MAPPLTIAMRPKPPSIMSNTARPSKAKTKSKPKPKKTTFLSLPQELRDHVYSFLPLQVISPFHMDFDGWHERQLATAIKLSRTCRTVREDMEEAFWSCAKFYQYVYPDQQPGDLHRRWMAKVLLSLISNLTLTFFKGVLVHWVSYDVEINLLKKDGAWLARLLPYKSKTMSKYELRVLIHKEEQVTKWVKSRELRDITIRKQIMERAQPYLDRTERELNRKGRITQEALRILAQMRIQHCWR
ncbi:hypothetical protein PRZ48_011894 [Zasmidium cellare]|uniref:F-box domain-containing protein n=1 Tax=Zasmidium cellare TaxID=395010 RepID=A0ABR0E8N4_ZASCE|nr:hypothetical protein PRZ48_011894 [Zasmidium cellare]